MQSLAGTSNSASTHAESQSGNKVGSKKSKKFYIPASSGLIKFRKSIAQETFKRLVADSLTYSDPCLLMLSQSSLDVKIFLSHIFVSRSSRRITGEKRKRDDVDAFREYEESVAELYSNLGVSLSSLVMLCLRWRSHEQGTTSDTLDLRF